MSGTQSPPAALANPPLPDDLAVCQPMIRELLASLREQRQDQEPLRARIDPLLRRLYGPRAEHFDPNQPLLFADLNTPAEATPAAPTPAPPAPEADQKTQRKGHGRKQLPGHLRRERLDDTLTEAERICPCCGKLRHEIGTDVTEQLDYPPASLFVVEPVQHAYACAACQGAVIRADKSPQPIPQGLPGPGWLAYVAVSKHADHLPLYRLEQSLARQGVERARSTLGAWLAQAADLLRPLYAEMIRRVRRPLVVHTDDTPVPVLDPEREHTRQGRLGLDLGDWMNPFNVFDYTPDHTQAGPQKFLAPFRGSRHADASAGYERVDNNQDVLEAACNAHARRKFSEARANDPPRAHQALAYSRQLYDVEDQIRQAEAQARQRAPMNATEAAWFRVWREEPVVLSRQEYALPIGLQFHAWLLAQKDQVLPKSPLGAALGYALHQSQALTEDLRQGFLAIDNNCAEREMKRVAMGRKNWLCAGSDNGGKTAAVLDSFTSTWQRHGLDPCVYLRDVFRRLPTQPAEQLAARLPERWQPLAQSLPPPSLGPPTEAALPASVSIS